MSIIDKLRNAQEQDAQKAPALVAPTDLQPVVDNGPVTGPSDFPVLVREEIPTLDSLYDERQWPSNLRAAAPEKLARLREFYANPDVDDELRMSYSNNAQQFIYDRARFYHGLSAIEREKGQDKTPMRLYVEDLYEHNPAAFKDVRRNKAIAQNSQYAEDQQATWEADETALQGFVKPLWNTIVDFSSGLIKGTFGVTVDQTNGVFGLTDRDVVYERIGEYQAALTAKTAEKYNPSGLLQNLSDGDWSGAADNMIGFSGSVVGSLLPTVAATAVGGPSAGFAATTGMTYGSIFNDVYAQTGNGADAFKTALVLAPIMGKLDSFSLGKMGRLADEASTIGLYRQTLREGLEGLAQHDLTTTAGRKLFGQAAMRVGEDLTRSGYLRQTIYPAALRLPAAMGNEALTEGIQSTVESVGKTISGNVLGNDAMLTNPDGSKQDMGTASYWKDVFAGSALEAIGGLIGGGIGLTMFMGGKVVDVAKTDKNWFLFKQNSTGLVGETAFYHIARAAATNDQAANASIDRLVERAKSQGKNQQQIETLQNNIAYIRQVAPTVFQGVTDGGAMYQVYHNHRVVDKLSSIRQAIEADPTKAQDVALIDSTIKNVEAHTAQVRSQNKAVGFRLDSDQVTDLQALLERGTIDTETTSFLNNSWRKGSEQYIQGINRSRHANGRAIEYDERTVGAINEANKVLGTEIPNSAIDNNRSIQFHELQTELSLDEIEAMATHPEELRNAVRSHKGSGKLKMQFGNRSVSVPVRLAAVVDLMSEESDGKLSNPLVGMVAKANTIAQAQMAKVRERAYPVATAKTDLSSEPSAAPVVPSATPTANPTPSANTVGQRKSVSDGPVSAEVQSELDQISKQVTADSVGYQTLADAFNSVNEGRRAVGMEELPPLDTMTTAERARFVDEAKRASKTSETAQANIAKRKAEKAASASSAPETEPTTTEKNKRAQKAPVEAKGKVTKKAVERSKATSKAKAKADEKVDKVTKPKPELKKKSRVKKQVIESAVAPSEPIAISAAESESATDMVANEVVTDARLDLPGHVTTIPDGKPDATVTREVPGYLPDTDIPDFLVDEEGGMTIDQSEIAMREAMRAHLSQVFGIEATMTDALMDEYGYGYVGRATQAGVEYAANAKAEVIPHEYSHFYWASEKLRNSELFQLGQKFLKDSKLVERLREIPQYAGLSDEKMELEALAQVTGKQFVDIWGDYFKAVGMFDKAQALARAFWRSVATVFGKNDAGWRAVLAANVAAAEMVLQNRVALHDNTMNGFADPMNQISAVEAMTRQQILNHVTGAMVGLHILNPDSPLIHFPHAVVYHRLMKESLAGRQPELKALREMFGGVEKLRQSVKDMDKLLDRLANADPEDQMNAARDFDNMMGMLLNHSIVLDNEYTGIPEFIHKVLSSTKGLPLRDLSFVAEEVGDAGNSPTFKALVTSLFDTNGRAFRPETVIGAVSALALQSQSPADFRKKLREQAKGKSVQNRLFNQMEQRLNQIDKDLKRQGSAVATNSLNAIYNEFRSTVIERILQPTLSISDDGSGLVTMERSNMASDAKTLLHETLADIKYRAGKYDLRESLRNIKREADMDQRVEREKALTMLRKVLSVTFGDRVNIKDNDFILHIAENLLGTNNEHWFTAMNDMVNNLANHQRGMTMPTVLKPLVEKTANAVFLFNELSTAYDDHNGQRQQAVTIANWSAAKSHMLFNINPGNQKENIAIMLESEFYRNNSMLKLWHKERGTGRTLVKGLQFRGEGIDMRDWNVNGHLFSDVLAFVEATDEAYLQNNGELGTREYKEMYLAERHAPEAARKMHGEIGATMAARANGLLDEGRLKVSDLATMNKLAYTKMKVNNGRFEYDATATEKALATEVDEMVEALRGMTDGNIHNRLLMAYLMGMDISVSDPGPTQRMAIELSKIPDMRARFDHLKQLNANDAVTRMLATHFVHNYAVNQRMLSDITMGNIYQYKEVGDYRKREMNQGSKGHEVGLDSQIHVLRMPDMLNPDGSKATDSFNIYDHNLNQAIQDAGGVIRPSGNNHKMALYHVDNKGNTYNVKSAALGVTLNADGKPSLQGYDHMKADGTMTNAYQAHVDIIEAYRATLPADQQANAKIMLAYESSVKNWGPGQVLSPTVLQAAMDGKLTPDMVRGKGNTIKPMSFRQNFNINAQYEGRDPKKKLPVQAMPMLLTMLRNMPQNKRANQAQALIEAINGLLEFQGTLLDENKVGDIRAMAKQLVGKAIMNNRSFASEVTTEHMLAILDEVENTGELSIEDPAIFSATLGKLTDLFNRAMFHPMLSGADLQMMPDLSGDLKWGDMPEVIVPSYMGRPGETIVLMRVPLSAPGSMFHAVIKGNSPKGTNTVIVPRGYPKVSNSDFDADKLFTFRITDEMINGVDGKPTDKASFYQQQVWDLQSTGGAPEAIKRAERRRDEAIMEKHRNQVVTAMMNILSSPEAIALRDVPLDTKRLRDALSKNGISPETEPAGLPMSTYRSREQTMEGAGAIGVFATAQKTGAMLAHAGVQLSDRQAVKLNIGKSKYHFVSYGFGGQQLTGEVLQVALDRVKEQLMMPLGVNSTVMAEMAMLMQLETIDGKSITPDDLVAFFTTPEVRLYTEAIKSMSGPLGGAQRLSGRDKLALIDNLLEGADQHGKDVYQALQSIVGLTNDFNAARRFVQLDDGIPYGLEHIKSIEYELRNVQNIADNTNFSGGLVQLIKTPMMTHRIMATEKFQSLLSRLTWRMAPQLIKEGGDVLNEEAGWYDDFSRRIMAGRYTNLARERKLLALANQMLDVEHLRHSYPDQKKFRDFFGNFLRMYIEGEGAFPGARNAMLPQDVQPLLLDPKLRLILLDKKSKGIATQQETALLDQHDAVLRAVEENKKNLFVQNLKLKPGRNGTSMVYLPISVSNASQETMMELADGFAQMPEMFQDLLHDYLLLTGQTSGALWQIVGGDTLMYRYWDTLLIKESLADTGKNLNMSFNFLATAMTHMYEQARSEKWMRDPKGAAGQLTPLQRSDVNEQQGVALSGLHALYPEGWKGLYSDLINSGAMYREIMNISGTYQESYSLDNGVVVKPQLPSYPLTGQLIKEETTTGTKYWMVNKLTIHKPKVFSVGLVDVTSVLNKHKDTILPLRQSGSSNKPPVDKSMFSQMSRDIVDIARTSRVIGNLEQGTPLISDKTVGNVFRNEQDVYEEMLKRLEKMFGGKVEAMPWEEYQATYGDQGTSVGQARVDRARAINRVVSWSMAGGRLDVVPHEYAHHYVDMLRETDFIKAALKQYNGDEEALVDAIGRSFYDMTKTELKKKSLWGRFWNLVNSIFQSTDVADAIAERMFNGSNLDAEDAAVLDKHWNMTAGTGYAKHTLKRSDNSIMDEAKVNDILGNRGGVGIKSRFTMNDAEAYGTSTFFHTNKLNEWYSRMTMTVTPNRRVAYLSQDTRFLDAIHDVNTLMTAYREAFIYPAIRLIDGIAVNGINDKLLRNTAASELLAVQEQSPHRNTTFEQLALLSLIRNPGTPDDLLIPEIPHLGITGRGQNGQLTNEALTAIEMAKHQYRAYKQIITTAEHLKKFNDDLIVESGFSHLKTVSVHDAVASVNDQIRTFAERIKVRFLAGAPSKIQVPLNHWSNFSQSRVTLHYKIMGGEEDMIYQSLHEAHEQGQHLSAQFRMGGYGGSSQGAAHHVEALRNMFGKHHRSLADVPGNSRNKLNQAFMVTASPIDGSGPVTIPMSIGEVIALRRHRNTGKRPGRYQPWDLMVKTGIALNDSGTSTKRVKIVEADMNEVIADFEVWAANNGIDLQMMDNHIDSIFELGHQYVDPIMRSINGLGIERQSKYWPLSMEKISGISTQLMSWVNNPRFGPVVGLYDADNYLRIDDAFKVLDDYVSETEMFLQTAMPVLNTDKLLRSSESPLNHEVGTIAQTMQSVGIIKDPNQGHGPLHVLKESLKVMADIEQNSKPVEWFTNVIAGLRRYMTAALLRMNIVAVTKQQAAYLMSSRHISGPSLAAAYAKHAGGLRSIGASLNPEQLRSWFTWAGNPVTNAPVLTTEMSQWEMYKEMVEYSPRLRERFSDASMEWFRANGESDSASRREHVGFRSALGKMASLFGFERPDWGVTMKQAMGMYTFMDMTITGMVWEAAKMDAEKYNGLTPGSMEYWDHVARLVERTVNDTQPTRDMMRQSLLHNSPWGLFMTFLQSSAARAHDQTMQAIYAAHQYRDRVRVAEAGKAVVLYGLSAVMTGLIGMLGAMGYDEIEKQLALLKAFLFDEHHEGTKEKIVFKMDTELHKEISAVYLAKGITQNLGGGSPLRNLMVNTMSEIAWQQYYYGLVKYPDMITNELPGANVMVQGFMVGQDLSNYGPEAALNRLMTKEGTVIVGAPQVPLRITANAMWNQLDPVE